MSCQTNTSARGMDPRRVSYLLTGKIFPKKKKKHKTQKEKKDPGNQELENHFKVPKLREIGHRNSGKLDIKKTTNFGQGNNFLCESGINWRSQQYLEIIILNLYVTEILLQHTRCNNRLKIDNKNMARWSRQMNENTAEMLSTSEKAICLKFRLVLSIHARALVGIFV